MSSDFSRACSYTDRSGRKDTCRWLTRRSIGAKPIGHVSQTGIASQTLSNKTPSGANGCWRGGNWREDRSSGRSTWPDQLAGSRLIHKRGDRQQETQERRKPSQSKTTGHKRSRPLSDGKTVIVL